MDATMTSEGAGCAGSTHHAVAACPEALAWLPSAGRRPCPAAPSPSPGAASEVAVRAFVASAGALARKILRALGASAAEPTVGNALRPTCGALCRAPLPPLLTLPPLFGASLNNTPGNPSILARDVANRGAVARVSHSLSLSPMPQRPHRANATQNFRENNFNSIY